LAVVVQMTQVVFGNLEAEGMQQQYWHDDVSLAMKPM
jgi:hypothetical protein